jgi:hypothetical protein
MCVTPFVASWVGRGRVANLKGGDGWGRGGGRPPRRLVVVVASVLDAARSDRAPTCVSRTRACGGVSNASAVFAAHKLTSGSRRVHSTGTGALFRQQSEGVCCRYCTVSVYSSLCRAVQKRRGGGKGASDDSLITRVISGWPGRLQPGVQDQGPPPRPMMPGPVGQSLSYESSLPYGLALTLRGSSTPRWGAEWKDPMACQHRSANR